MSPTIVVCPGAWSFPELFRPLLRALEARGYPTVCKVISGYPNYDPTNPPLVNPDCEYLREEVLTPLLDDGKEVVLLMHSYGGVYGAAAIEGLTKKQRAKQGLKGGIVSLIFAAGHCVKKGVSAMGAMGIGPETVPIWIDHDKSRGMMTFNKNYAKAMLFSGLPDEEAERLASQLPAQPYSCFFGPVHWDPYDDPDYDGIMGYVFTEGDRIMPIKMQQMYVKTANIKLTARLRNAPHFVHLVRPEELAQAVVGVLKDLYSGAPTATL